MKTITEFYLRFPKGLYLQSNDTLSKSQSGNKKWHSCETSVIEATDTILNASDKKKLTAVVLRHGLMLLWFEN